MPLRITLQTEVDRALFNLRRETDLLGIATEQASSGKRILQPSDDPVGAVNLISYHAQDNRFGTYISNIQDASTTLETAGSSLQDASGILQQVRDLTIQATNSVNDQDALNALGEQVNSLLSRFVDVANSQSLNHFVFSGTATTTKPFVLGPGGRYVYKGSNNNGVSIVGQSQTVNTYYPGNSIFQVRQRGATIYTTSTGAAPGAGTDSATGQGTLLVTHTATTYAPGSGVAIGANSPSGDTIIGPAGAHTLTIVDTSGTGASGTVSLDNGPPVNWTNTDTNLQVNGNNSDAVFINAAGITAGFNGTVNITATGTLSVDNGATSVPINFTGNQVITNSLTGEVTNVDSTNIRSVGSANLSYTGTYDAFQIIQAIRDDMLNTRNLPQAEQLQSLSGRLQELDRVRNNLLNGLGIQSADAQNLQSLQSHVINLQLETRVQLSNTEDVDLTQVAIALSSQQNLLQLTLSQAAHIFDPSLLNFLGSSPS